MSLSVDLPKVPSISKFEIWSEGKTVFLNWTGFNMDRADRFRLAARFMVNEWLVPYHQASDGQFRAVDDCHLIKYGGVISYGLYMNVEEWGWAWLYLGKVQIESDIMSHEILSRLSLKRSNCLPKTPTL